MIRRDRNGRAIGLSPVAEVLIMLLACAGLTLATVLLMRLGVIQ